MEHHSCAQIRGLHAHVEKIHTLSHLSLALEDTDELALRLSIILETIGHFAEHAMDILDAPEPEVTA
jgi:hypothetical protein